MGEFYIEAMYVVSLYVKQVQIVRLAGGKNVTSDIQAIPNKILRVSSSWSMFSSDFYSAYKHGNQETVLTSCQ